MQKTLEILLERTRTRLSGLERQIEELPEGRGGEWKALLHHVWSEFQRDFASSEADLARAAGGDQDDTMQAHVAQHLERVQLLLDQLHLPMATYRESVARSDVPVGLQHLIDVLMEDIVIDDGDPIVHLDGWNMYSTIDLTSPINELISGLGPAATPYTGRHPIAFNLPALDPKNALLSPVLAHEVAHTAVKQKLLTDLQTLVDSGPLGALLQQRLLQYAATASQEDVLRVAGSFQSWTSELICDAVAVAVSGPSFLLAFTAFVTPPTAAAGAGSHPPVHDRIRFALQLVDELGWTPFMRQRAPQLMEWLESVAGDIVLDHSAEETFLRWAMESTREARQEVAFAHLDALFVPDGQEERLDEAARWLAEGVPMIDIGNQALSPWQAVLAGWMAAVTVNGDASTTIVRAAGDRDYNAVIVKALEYSQIVTAWRTA